MATTSLWRIKGSMGRVVDYVENADKTTAPIAEPAEASSETLENLIAYAGREEATNLRKLITGIQVDPERAREQMADIKTRQHVKDIKVLDKASVAGERMKNEKHSYRIYCRLRVPPCVEKTGNLVRLLEKYENCAIIYYVSLHAESNWDGWMLSLQTGGGE